MTKYYLGCGYETNANSKEEALENLKKIYPDLTIDRIFTKDEFPKVIV